MSRASEAMPVLILMRSLLPTLRPSEQRIARLFLDDPRTAAGISIRQLAESAQTSTTSVIRLSKRLGYQHVRELRADILHELARETYEAAGLAEVTGDIDRNDSLEDVVAKVSFAETLSIADTGKSLSLVELSRAVDAIASATRVVAFGVGASAFVGQDLQQKLTRIGRSALSCTDAHAAWTAAATLEPGSVAIAVSHSGETVDTVDFLQFARKAGSTTIALTNHPHSALAAHAEIVLTTAARETPFRSGALGSRIAQLMVIDCVFIGVAQANFDRSMAAIRATYAAVHRRPHPS